MSSLSVILMYNEGKVYCHHEEALSNADVVISPFMARDLLHEIATARLKPAS
jgi:hypothetical protein